MNLGVNGRFLTARPTGVQRFAREIVRRVAARVERPTLLLPRGAGGWAEWPAGAEVVRGRLRGHAWEQLEIPGAARRGGCDVTLHPANTLPLAGGPHVVVVHDVEPLVRPEAFAPAFVAWYRRVQAPAARRAARIVTVSRAAAEAISDALGVPSERIRVADQGAAPLDAPASPAAVERARRRFGLSGPYVLAVGGGDPRKNLPFLRAVWARWRARRAAGEPLPAPPVLLVVHGGDPRVFARSDDGRPPGAGELHVGRVDDETLRALYTGAEALAFPSLGEGFGRPPLEALACGTPAVVAPYPAASEVLGDGALRLDLDPDRWVDAFAALAREAPAQAAVRRERMRATVERHRWEAGTDAVIAACAEAAGERPGARSAVVPASARVVDLRADRVDAERTPWTDPPLADLKVAVVHDWLTGMRGGEKVLEALLELVPGADLFTLLHVRGSVSEAIEARAVRTSFVQHLPAAARRYRSYLPLFPAAIERLDLSGYDLVLSSSHCVAKGAIARSGAPHLCYCHTPMRYVWDQMDAYLGRGKAGPLVRVLGPAVAARLRRWDVATAPRVTRFVANSAYVRERIRRHWGRDARVVHPPVDVDRFDPTRPREDTYLVVSALVPYKRIELAVEACTRSGRRLEVVGTGPELGRLRALAGPSVTFAGWLPDDEVADRMARCRALLMPGVEDFGIVPVEAQAAGAPVIALGEGGVTETVVAGEGEDATGVLFDEVTPDALLRALDAFERRTFAPAAARRNALRFARERFLEEMRAELCALRVGAAAP